MCACLNAGTDSRQRLLRAGGRCTESQTRVHVRTVRCVTVRPRLPATQPRKVRVGEQESRHDRHPLLSPRMHA